MEIKLPIIIKVADYHEFENINEILNKVLVCSKNDDNQKKSVNFIELGCLNEKYLGFFYNNEKKLDNNEIVKTLLLEEKRNYKSIAEVKDFLDNILEQKILKDVDLNIIVQQLELENNIVFKKHKPKI
jgi:hypothetical protein